MGFLVMHSPHLRKLKNYKSYKLMNHLVNIFEFGGLSVNKKYIFGVIVGFLLVMLAMPLGELYGKAYITIGNGMAVDRYTMLMERAIVSFQLVGGLVSALSGLAYIFKK